MNTTTTIKTGSRAKRNYNIEIDTTERICGGYLLTTPKMTERQVTAMCERMGRELMKEDEEVDFVRYWVSHDDDEDFEEMLSVSLFKYGGTVTVTVTK